MTSREKLHRLVDELSETEVEAALARLLIEREAVDEWQWRKTRRQLKTPGLGPNAREAIREEPW